MHTVRGIQGGREVDVGRMSELEVLYHGTHSQQFSFSHFFFFYFFFFWKRGPGTRVR